MTLIFAGFLFIVLLVSRDSDREIKPISPDGLGEITPAYELVSKNQIEAPQPQQIASPDGAYIIDRPPDDWLIEQMSLVDLLARNMRIDDPTSKKDLIAQFGGAGNTDQLCLTFQVKQDTLVIPIPGKTLIEGRHLLTALEVSIPTRLTIVPIDKAQAPLFDERPLIHNFTKFVSDVLYLGVLPLRDLSSGVAQKNGRTYLLAEFRQDIENAIVNGREGQSIRAHTTIIGIEGDVQDYILTLNYSSQSTGDDQKLTQNLDTLRSLVSSFRPLKVLNREKQLLENKKQAEQKFKESMKQNGEELFYTEFYFLLLRLRGIDFNDPDLRLKAMKLLEPFELFAKEIKLDDSDLNKLWSALHKSEKGNSLELSKVLIELSNDVLEDETEKQPAALPAKTSSQHPKKLTIKKKKARQEK